MKLVNQLKTHFPLLSNLDLDSLFDSPLDKLNPRCIIARRGEAYSLAIYIASAKVPELFSALGVGVPQALTDNILANTPRVLFDVDSIGTAQLRFYVYHKDYVTVEPNTLEQTYPFNAVKPAQTLIEGLGFFMENSPTGTVTQYKYYFLRDLGASNFRFDASGTLINTFEESGAFNPDSSVTTDFNQFLAGLDLTGHGVSYVSRDDGTNSYIVINQMVDTNVAVFPLGGNSTQSTDYEDPALKPPEPEPTPPTP